MRGGRLASGLLMLGYLSRHVAPRAIAVSGAITLLAGTVTLPVGMARVAGASTHSRARDGSAAVSATGTLGAASPMSTSAPSVTISPLPGTRDAAASTQISFLGAPASEIRNVSVVGSRSGAHSGAMRAYASAPGASFLPSKPFLEGEQIRVSALVGPSGSTRRAVSNFTVARHDYAYHFRPLSAPGPPKPGTFQSFVSEPALKPAPVIVTDNSAQAASGDIFLSPRHSSAQDGPMIIDSAGNLVWSKPLPSSEGAMDFKVARYQGQPVLLWWQGSNAPLAQLGLGFGVDEIYDSSYHQVAQIRAGNGYWADLHEVQITPQGSAFITAETLVRADLSSVGGYREGALADGVVQQIDIKTGLVMFEWHAWGHVALNDSFTHSTSPTNPWDWFHLNSISLGPDDDMLISARNTWTVYDVSLATGDVLWRLGGRKPSFHMGSGTGTAWQHNARWQADHTITIFDDGATPKEHSQSRVIREQIDWKSHSVSLIERDVHTPALLAGSQGNDQILPNGDSFVGWGSEPYFSEFSPSGQLVYDGHMQAPAQSYRAYKFPWSATPGDPPSIAVKTTAGGADTVYASWNGATEVAQWRVLAGASASSLTPLATVARTGFETAIPVSATAPKLGVQALDSSGHVLGISAVVGAG